MVEKLKLAGAVEWYIDLGRIKDYYICSFSTETIESNHDYVGMLVMDIGSFPAKERTGWNIMPGWILIKKSADVAHF